MSVKDFILFWRLILPSVTTLFVNYLQVTVAINTALREIGRKDKWF